MTLRDEALLLWIRPKALYLHFRRRITAGPFPGDKQEGIERRIIFELSKSIIPRRRVDGDEGCRLSKWLGRRRCPSNGIKTLDLDVTIIDLGGIIFHLLVRWADTSKISSKNPRLVVFYENNKCPSRGALSTISLLLRPFNRPPLLYKFLSTNDSSQQPSKARNKFHAPNK